MTEYGIFNDDSADHTAAEAVEAQFYSRQEAENALHDRYNSEEDSDCYVHEVEEPEEDEDEEEQENEDDDIEDMDGNQWPRKY